MSKVKDCPGSADGRHSYTMTDEKPKGRNVQQTWTCTSCPASYTVTQPAWPKPS